MALTDEQRAELDALDIETIHGKLRLAGPGQGAAVAGFKTGPLGLTRSDVEAYLAERVVRELKAQRRASITSLLVAVVGVVATIVGIGVMVWLAK
jgi:hypothetical protein